MVSSYSAVSRAPLLAGTLVLATSVCLGTMSALADYIPPKLVPYEELVAATKEVMSRPSIPTKGADGWVEDLFRINAAGIVDRPPESKRRLCSCC
jgi:hypothetical protein